MSEPVIIEEEEARVIREGATRAYRQNGTLAALRAGHTIWRPGRSGFGPAAQRMHDRGFRIRQRVGERDGVRGMYFWLEAIE